MIINSKISQSILTVAVAWAFAARRNRQTAPQDLQVFKQKHTLEQSLKRI